MMTGFALYLLWEAMLISYLSQRTVTLPFTDLASLISNSDYKIGLQVGSEQENCFRDSNDPLFKKAWIDRIEPNLENYKNYMASGGSDHTTEYLPLGRIPIDYANTAMYHPYYAAM